MILPPHQRGNLTNAQWQHLQPLLPPEKPSVGRPVMFQKCWKTMLKFSMIIYTVWYLSIFSMTVWIPVECPHCHRTDVSKFGKSAKQKQRYLCKNEECPYRTFILDHSYDGRKPEVKQQIIEMVRIQVGGSWQRVHRGEKITNMKSPAPKHHSDEELNQLSREQLVETIKTLQAEIARLKEILNIDSKTSSKPPSGDLLKKSEKNQPQADGESEKPKRKPGGQPGHEGKTRMGA